jgi:Matrixin/FG-GAP-like repeat
VVASERSFADEFVAAHCDDRFNGRVLITKGLEVATGAELGWKRHNFQHGKCFTVIMGIVRAGAGQINIKRPKRLWSPVIPLAILILLSCGENSRPYALEGPKWPTGSVVNFQLSLGPAGRTLTDGNTSFDTAAAPAPLAWDAVMANLVLQTTTQSATAVSGDGRNTIVLASTAFGDSFGNRTLAETVYLSSGSTMQEADILFNNHQTWNSYRGALRYDGSGNAIPEIRRVLIHEMGHAIGLDHPDDHGQHVDAIMNSIISNRETLSPDDIAGAQFLYGAPPVVSVKADFNADQRADYLLFNASTRQTAVWHLQGSTFLDSAYGPTLPAGWALIGTADVNLDGKPDYILFNSSTRQTAVWYLNDTSYTGGAMGRAIPAGWNLIAVADVDGDGHPDYVLFNPATGQTAIWYLHATRLVGSAWGPVLPAGLTLADVNDFNDDGKADFVLANTSTRQTYVWFMDGAAVSSGADAPPIPSGWMLQGTADFNHDGKPDYLLFNRSTRQTAQWYLNGTTLLSGAAGPALPLGYTLIAR